jgi:hypothetical protein
MPRSCQSSPAIPVNLRCISAAAAVVAASTRSERRGASSTAGGETPVAAMSTRPRASKRYELQFIQGISDEEFYITMQCGARPTQPSSDIGPTECDFRRLGCDWA